MADIELKITGLAELEQALETLPLKASRRIVRQEATAAAEPWAQEMRSIVRRGPHHDAAGKVTFDLIANNIVQRATVHNDLSATVKVGPAANVGGYKLFYVWFLELTGRAAGVGPSGRHYPAMPRYPFIRPAFDVAKGDVLDRFISGIRAALQAAGLRLS
jgi:HK97 gp10 family phage protein